MSHTDTIAKIHKALDFSQDEGTAKAFGINEVDGEFVASFIAEDQDVYELLDNINKDKFQNLNEHFAIITYGWAAPLNSDGEVDGAPSAHPMRRRVRLVATVSKLDRKMGSAITFKDDDEVIIDEGSASGSLADAMMSLFD